MKFVILFFIVLVKSYANANDVVQTNCGRIEGYKIINDLSEDIRRLVCENYYAFEGIPYAEPPLGKLRFQAPQKPKPWTDIRETKFKKSKCVQATGGLEDCLYLNVFTPKLPNENDDKKLAVMVFIHGGAFLHGSSNHFNPDYLLNKNIVLVTFNYRLNVFGFLNARSESAQGNVGLKDQVAVLQWVQENIDKFGGDPNKVTIFGHSAGAASVNYLMLSKQAKGLFHRAIMQSGSVLNAFAIYKDPTSIVYKLGNFLKCKSMNMTEIVRFLQNVPSQELLKAALNTEVLGDFKHRFRPIKWTPSIENEIPGAFITESSYSAIINNKISNPVPTIIGYTNGEAGFFLNEIKSKIIDIDYYSSNLNYLVPESLNINNNEIKMNEVTKDILEHFFDNDTKLITNRNFIKYQSQNIIDRGVRKTIELMRPHMDLYFYRFTYKSNELSTEYDGVPHGDEMKYLFYKYENSNNTSENYHMIDKMVTLWTNFAKFGNPTPDNSDSLNIIWPKVSKDDTNETLYLKICTTLKIAKNPNPHCYMFWESIFENYGNPPFFVW